MNHGQNFYRVNSAFTLKIDWCLLFFFLSNLLAIFIQHNVPGGTSTGS